MARVSHHHPGIRGAAVPVVGSPPRGFLPIAAVAFASALVLIATLIALGFSNHGNPARYFGEGRPGTTATVIAFAAAAVASWLVRGDLKPDRFARFWAMAAAGFLYLARDDEFKIHENLDIAIHALLGLDAQAGISDRLDDAILASYPVFAALVALPFRRELLRLRWCVLMLGLAFCGFGMMLVFESLPYDNALQKRALGAAEESSKLLGAVAMLMAIFAARMHLEQRAGEHVNRDR